MFVLNTHRTYKQPVTVTTYDENGREQTGKFTATFKVLPHDQARESGDARLLDLVLMDVEDVQVADESGQPLTGDALLDALKNDPAASSALIASYNDSIVKKNRSRTF